MNSNDGKKLKKVSRKATQTNKSKVSRSGEDGDRKPEGGGDWNKKSKKAMKTPNGLKTVILVLSEEEKTNKASMSHFNSVKNLDGTPVPHITVVNAPDTNTPLIGSVQDCFPATSVKPQIIIQNNKNDFIPIHTLMKAERLYWHLITT